MMRKEIAAKWLRTPPRRWEIIAGGSIAVAGWIWLAAEILRLLAA